jgi:maltose alpha-D-glucosyltransferase/alpha-amylase
MVVRWLSAEQSNSSLIIGDMAMIKLIRHIFAGVHPEVEMTRYLTKVGYQNTPPLLGEVVRTAPDGSRFTLMIVQGAIRNQGDGWGWMLTNLRRALDDVTLTEGGEEAADDHLKPLVDFAATVGLRLGELHVALAQPTEDQDFSPVHANASDVEDWEKGVIAQVMSALAILSDTRDLDANSSKLVSSILARREEVISSIHHLAASAAGTLRTRNHGDFHLGQILVSEGDAYIIDFEGEPSRDLEERRAKGNPLRDVAGLLRSLSYLAATADLETEAVTDTQDERRTHLIRRFAEQAETAFLESYLDTVQPSETLAMSREKRQQILDLYLLEKAAYEIAYEARNRPKWLPIPLNGFAAIVDRLSETLA